MKISTNGISLIKRFEGCHLSPYYDVGGVLTVGYGHLTNSKNTISQATADRYLEQDLEKYEKRVSVYCEKYGLSQCEFDALVSFDFNTGAINQLTKSGKRDINDIWKNFKLYNKVKGKNIPGLTERRNMELEYAKCATDKQVSNLFAKWGIPHSPLNVAATLEYLQGEVYITKVGLAVRETPWGRKKGREEWTKDGRAHDKDTNNYLDKGTRVTNIATSVIKKDREESVWMKIPSGYICARNGKEVYVEPCHG